MSSLHARRPPKLEQGDLRRNKQRNTGHAPIKGGGSLRRPPNAVGIDISKGGGGNGGNGSNKRFCSLRRMIMSVLVVIFLTFLFIQIRHVIFGASIVKSGGSGLRVNQGGEPIATNPDAKLG
mmetsp:Transcript_458/g.1019  ORF Transcript_458/g.1019 Transcript_458/m.1019 type:complete len:122 (-) Transcript_458:306-671(-)|eukprot:CAMPEP_0201881248 /NCGR_PEP_ID=MMETSP0902-20130614/11608_1 /ASSEMBLY_ACC=CAM_ASM_000551 /TAXON_ID=420261 /ORGANISM="Thalassiosira antarctica, Strain CCMP982" /LENGTH=121 /DNA_ID=CAMNT_0048409405 /DNA_START=322 /DNA_END=687 /DNA_ORIENTATION=+